MGISRSAYYYKPKVGRVEKEKQDADIRAAIERHHVDLPAAGYRPMLEYLRSDGIVVGERRLRRIMKESGLQAMITKAFVRTTDSEHGFPVYRNLLPEMGVDGVNQVWVVDITYIRILTGFVFLAVVLDVYSRKVIGWAISKKIDAELTCAALRMAIEERNPPPGCIHHSDRGVQYLCDAYVEILLKHGFHISHAAKGNPYENAFAESFMKTLKANECHLWEYETIWDVLERIPRFLEEVYNRKRVHSALGNLSPEAFEKKWGTEVENQQPAGRPVLIL